MADTAASGGARAHALDQALTALGGGGSHTQAPPSAPGYDGATHDLAWDGARWTRQPVPPPVDDLDALAHPQEITAGWLLHTYALMPALVVRTVDDGQLVDEETGEVAEGRLYVCAVREMDDVRRRVLATVDIFQADPPKARVLREWIAAAGECRARAVKARGVSADHLGWLGAVDGVWWGVLRAKGWG